MENSNTVSPVIGGQDSRLQWLDAMRGFTMILVVTYHVAHMSFGMTDKYSSCQPFLVLFRMPLFFFVSGFLAYKAQQVWTGKLLASLSWKKLKIQVLPAFVFLWVSILLLHKHPWSTFLADLQSPTKGGYWFTWVLLHMFIVYYLVDFFGSRLRKYKWMPVVLLWGVMVVLYCLSYIPSVMKSLPAGLKTFLDYSSLIQTVHYFQFFLFGNLVSRYWSWCQKLMDTKWFFIVVLLLAFAGTGDCLVWHLMRLEWRNLPLTTASYALLLLVLMFFRYYKDWFTKDKVVGRSLQYIGTRTLDIYLLHYLFLPALPMVGKWMNQHRHLFLIDFTLSTTVALIVIGFCLIASHLLRINPILSEYLFGRPHNKKA